jgi:Flp pilus assembly pilin Flp
MKNEHGYGLVEVGLFLVLLAVAAVIAVHYL